MSDCEEGIKPAPQKLLQQQERFDDLIDSYNHERPHRALDMGYLAELYGESPWPCRA